MPYRDKMKQREYQREYQRNKRRGSSTPPGSVDLPPSRAPAFAIERLTSFRDLSYGRSSGALSPRTRGKAACREPPSVRKRFSRAA